MKKCFKFIICKLAIVLVCNGGPVYFNNYAVFVGDSGARFYDDRNTPLSGTNYLAQLYAGDTDEALVAVSEPVSFQTGAESGYFNGGIVDLAFVFPGRRILVQIRAWDKRGGLTFEKAAISKHWTGVSGSLYVVPGGWGDPPFGPAQLFGLKYPGRPVIVLPPKDVKLRVGQSTELSVIVSGGIDLSYQWYHGESGDTSQPVIGATNAVLHTLPLTNNASLWASASTAVGSTNSAAATITVFPTNTVFLDLGIVDALPHLAIDLPSVGPVEIQSWDGNGSLKWDVLSTVSPSTNPFTFVDSSATNDSARFYRVVRP